jgi:alanyl-tRNA synthetase
MWRYPCGKNRRHRIFKIVKEEASSANIRRIEAYTGLKALQYVQKMEETIISSAELLSTTPDKMTEKIEKNLELMKSLEDEVKTYLT